MKVNNEAGLASLDELRASSGYPSEERLEKGPVAVIECIQGIPCNPCESACRFNAIVVGKPITNLPRLLEEKCRGCGLCVALCPYGALEIVETEAGKKAHTIEVACKGCGTCGATCYRGAITMKHYSNDQLVAQIRAAFALE